MASTIKREGNGFSIQQNGKWIKLGELDAEKRVFSTFRNREKHLFKNFNAYGFNRGFLEDNHLFDYVYIKERTPSGKNMYFVPREHILANGRLYKAPGFENQVFISLEEIEQFKMK